jgi:hypothetical protein
MADTGVVRAWWARLELVEETLGGLEMEAQARVERLRDAQDELRRTH